MEREKDEEEKEEGGREEEEAGTKEHKGNTEKAQEQTEPLAVTRLFVSDALHSLKWGTRLAEKNK